MSGGRASRSRPYTEWLAAVDEKRPAYHGKTVGPKDKDKVLLRWKLDDGRYEVIFGDLHSETMTAERLRALEGEAGRD